MPNGPTLVNPIADLTIGEDSGLFNYQISPNTFSFVSGYSQNFQIMLADGSNLPSWLVFDPYSLKLQGVPPPDFNGTLRIALSAYTYDFDSEGRSITPNATAIFSLNVSKLDDAPVVVAPVADRVISQTSAWAFQIPETAFRDADGDKLALTVGLSSGGALPYWLSFDAATRTLSGTPPVDWRGTLDIRITASDGDASVSDTFTVRVNDRPKIVKPVADLVGGTEDSTVTFAVTPSFSDSDGDALSLAVRLANGDALPAWLTYQLINGQMFFSAAPPVNYSGALDIALDVSDGRDVTRDVFRVTITGVNDAPEVYAYGLDDQRLSEDAAWRFQIPAGTFTDVDNVLIYTARLASGAALPSWMKFDGKTQTFSGTPPLDFSGALDITVTASDGKLNVADTFRLTVDAVNDAPRVKAPIVDKVGAEEKPVSFTVTPSFVDVDSAGPLAISWSLADGQPLPVWLTVTNNGGKLTFSGTPPQDLAGAIEIAVTASDGLLSTSDVFKLTLANINDAPVLAAPIADQVIGEDQAWSFRLPVGTFTDVDSPLTYSAKLASGAALPTWLKLDGKTGTFTKASTNDVNGAFTVIVTASDGLLKATDTFVLTVTPENDAPRITRAIPDQVGVEEKLLSFKVTPAFVDVDTAGPLTYSAQLANGQPLPAWLSASFSGGVMTFTGTPPANLTGVIELAVVASDGQASTADVFRLTLANVNDAPVVAAGIPDAAIPEDGSFTIPAGAFTDVDTANLIYSAKLASGAALPAWLTFNPATRTFTPAKDKSGTAEITVTASDGSFKVTDTFVLTVTPENDAPRIAATIPDQVAKEDAAVSFKITPRFVDPEGTGITYAAAMADGSPLPGWLSASSAGGVWTFTGTPPQNFAGVLDLAIVASDGLLSTADTFKLTVANVNDAPVVTAGIADTVIPEDGRFTIPVGAFTDVDSAKLAYSAKLASGGALPSWLTFDGKTGSFAPVANASGVADILVTASDGQYSVQDTFKLTVQAVNDAPVLAKPIANQVGQSGKVWTLKVADGTFTDVDKDVLTYSAKMADGNDLPSWLTFDAVTKTFTGTPPSDWNGAIELKLVASDPSLAITSDTFWLTNGGPVLMKPIADQELAEAVWSFGVPDDLFDPGTVGAATGWTATLKSGAALPSWLKFDASTLTFKGTPPDGFAGDLELKVTASAGTGASRVVLETETFSMKDEVPILVTEIDKATTWSFKVPAGTFQDFNSASLTYSAKLTSGAALPTWLKFDASTQTFSGKPPVDFQAGYLDILVTASDGAKTSFDVFRLHQGPEYTFKYATDTWDGNGTKDADFRYDGLFWSTSGRPGGTFRTPGEVGIEAGIYVPHDIGLGLHTDIGLRASTVDVSYGFDLDPILSNVVDVLNANPYLIAMGQVTGPTVIDTRAADASNTSVSIDFEARFRAALEFVIGVFAGSDSASTTITTPEIDLGVSQHVITVNDDTAPLSLDLPGTKTEFDSLFIKNFFAGLSATLPGFSALDAQLGVPGSIDTHGTSVGADAGTGLGELTSSGSSDAFMKATLDLRALFDLFWFLVYRTASPLTASEMFIEGYTQVALGVDKGPFSISLAAAGADISLIDAALNGEVALNQSYGFRPDIGVTVVSEFGEVRTGKLGDQLFMEAPRYTSGQFAGQYQEGEGSFQVTATYDLNGYLTAGVSGTLSGALDWAFLTATLFAQIGLEVSVLGYGFFAGVRVEAPPISFIKGSLDLGSKTTGAGSFQQFLEFGTVTETYTLDWERFRTVDISGDNFDFTTHQLEASGNARANQLKGNAFGNIIDGGGGDDILRGLGGNDLLFGDNRHPDDQPYSTTVTGDDFLDGGDGNDSIVGDLGNDTILGGSGVDTLLGGSGADSIEGGANRDLIFGGWGDDTIIGGAGDDDLQGSGQGILADPPGPDGYHLGGYTDRDIFVFAPGSGHDMIWAWDQLSNVSLNNRDVIDLTAFKDLHSFDELDIRQAPNLAMAVYIDSSTSISFTGIYTPQQVPLIQQLFEFRFNPEPYTGPPVKIVGTTGTVAGDGDRIHGRNVDNIMDGGGAADKGDDILDGRGGHDLILGWGGDDTLVGGLGNDTLVGGTGNDRLVAGAGSNKLTGGSGAIYTGQNAYTNDDTFVFKETGKGFINTITDFKQKAPGNLYYDGDKIDLSQSDANGNSADGIQHWQIGSLVKSLTPDKGVAGVLYEIYSGATPKWDGYSYVLPTSSTIQLVGKTGNHDQFDLHIVLQNQTKLIDVNFDLVL